MKVFGVRKRFILFPPIVFILGILITIAIYSPVRIHYVYGILPVIIAQNPKSSTDGRIATSRGPLILIDSRFINNEKIIKHEMVHVRQYYRTLSMSSWLSFLSKEHLVDIEVEAYITEIKSPEDFVEIAEHIRTEYAPEVSEEYIINRLWKYWRSKR